MTYPVLIGRSSLKKNYRINPKKSYLTGRIGWKLKVAILSRNKNLYSTNRLYNAGTKRGHYIEIIDYLRCYINIGENQTAIYYNSNKLGNYDAVLPRIGASQTSYGTAIVRQFEMTGNYVVNKSDAIIASRDLSLIHIWRCRRRG